MCVSIKGSSSLQISIDCNSLKKLLPQPKTLKCYLCCLVLLNLNISLLSISIYLSILFLYIKFPVSVSVSIYTYTYIYTYIHTYIYIYIYSCIFIKIYIVYFFIPNNMAHTIIDEPPVGAQCYEPLRVKLGMAYYVHRKV